MVGAAEWRWAAFFLIGGMVIFLVGAGAWKPNDFQKTLAESVEVMARYPGRIQWITGWMICGVLLSTFGLDAFRRCLANSGGGSLGWWVLGPFAVGALLMIAAMFLMRTAILAAPPVEAAELPASVLRTYKVSGALYVGHMVLAYGSWIALGIIALKGPAVFPPWFAWTSIGAGAVFLLGFAVLRGGVFAPPFLAHLITLVGGIVLAIRPPVG